MRIAVFSDVHGNRYALDTFLEQVMPKVDCAVFCGDAVGYYYHANEVLTKLREDRRIFCLIGNHDRMLSGVIEGTQDRQTLVSRYGNAYSASLSVLDPVNYICLKLWGSFFEFEIDGVKVACAHGSLEDSLDGRIYPDTRINQKVYKQYDYVFLGHTHHRMMQIVGQTFIVNPGSLGQPRDDHGSSYLILDTTEKEISFYSLEYDSVHLESEVTQFDQNNRYLLDSVRKLRHCIG